VDRSGGLLVTHLLTCSCFLAMLFCSIWMVGVFVYGVGVRFELLLHLGDWVMIV